MTVVQGRGAAGVRVLLARARRAGLIPGGVAAWQVGEEPATVVAEGVARLRPAVQPAHARYLYDLASLTKPLATVTLFLLARRAGLVDFDSRLDEVLPETEGRAAGSRRMVELLAHTAGLAAWAPLYALARDGSRGAVLEAILALPVAERGQVVYSDLGFILLGLVLERVLKQPLAAEFTHRTAALPNGAVAGTFSPDPVRMPIAGGASGPGAEEALCRMAGLSASMIPASVEGLPDDGNARLFGGAAGHAGLFGTAAAVLTLARQYLPGAGTLLTDGEIHAVTRAVSPPGPLVRSAGWQLASSRGSSAGPALSPDSWGHTGFTGTSVWVDPTRRAVLVLLTNRHHPVHRGIDLHPLRRRFHAMVLGV